MRTQHLRPSLASPCLPLIPQDPLWERALRPSPALPLLPQKLARPSWVVSQECSFLSTLCSLNSKQLMFLNVNLTISLEPSLPSLALKIKANFFNQMITLSRLGSATLIFRPMPSHVP